MNASIKFCENLSSSQDVERKRNSDVNVWSDCVNIGNKNNSAHDTYVAEISLQSID